MALGEIPGQWSMTGQGVEGRGPGDLIRRSEVEVYMDEQEGVKSRYFV